MNTSTPYAEGTAGSRPAKSIARHLPTVARILMGLLFLITGLNGFLNFIPPPKDPMPEAAVAFMDGLMKSGYMFQLISGTGLLVSVLLLLNRFVPLALALIAPVVVNIVAFHVFIAPSGLGIALVVLALELYLAWSYRSSYRTMLAARVTPG
jgi:uncharacterized membrane protein YphA (DoxX/SURF4 family)